jgi:hypothetical protein
VARGFADFARIYLTSKSTFISKLGVPVLLWEARAELNPAEEQWNRTESGIGIRMSPRAGDPVVFELRKQTSKKNPFAMGITLGRVETNDIVIDDASISRFHAWFQNDPKQGWLVVDAESKNGSAIDGQKLVANKKTPIADGARLKFGEIELLFLSPQKLVQRIEASFGGT